MALPSYWVSLNRKDLAEKAIVAKRDKEASRIQKCKEVASYHQDLALKSSKYRSLEDPQSVKIARANEESRIKERLKAEKQDKLEIRRHRLAHFLSFENDQYMKELNELKEMERERDPWNICKLKEQIENLQQKRKEGEQNMQKRYMHHLYKTSNNIYTKENADDEKLKKEASEAWKHRKQELEKLSLEKKQKEEERIKTFELEQLKATKEARDVEMMQLEEQERWSNFVQGKVEELHIAENESKKLKIEKQILTSHMENLLSLQQRRDLVRDIQKKGALRIHGLWQPKEKLRRMLSEVQHALDLDFKMLTNICAMNNSAAEDTALALLHLDLAEDIKCKIERQIALEKNRELEIQQLFNEEASKLWETRKEEWTLEAIARDELIDDLFKSLSESITKKVEKNIEQQKKLVLVKENCLKEIDEANEDAKSKRKTLEEKMSYFVDKAKRLGDELQAYKCPASSS